MELTELLSKRLRPPRELLSHRSSAAVMLILQPSNGDLRILFVRRREDPKDPWSGQVALPGGRRIPSDRSIIETAVRETFEEVGILLEPEQTVLGALPDVRPLRYPDMLITPFVALMKEDRPIRLSPELSGYFWAPIRSLKEDEVKVSLQNGETKIVRAYVYRNHVIWGLTARVVGSLLKILKEETT